MVLFRIETYHIRHMYSLNLNIRCPASSNIITMEGTHDYQRRCVASSPFMCSHDQDHRKQRCYPKLVPYTIRNVCTCLLRNPCHCLELGLCIQCRLSIYIVSHLFSDDIRAVQRGPWFKTFHRAKRNEWLTLESLNMTG